MKTEHRNNRVSTNLDHPDYKADYWNYSATLNGEHLNFCNFADSEKGEVHCYSIDKNGNLILEGYSLKVDVMFGDVVITYEG